MRIGILTHNYPQRSTERKDAGIFLYDFAHELAKKHQVFVLSPNFQGEKENYKEVPVTWFEWGGGDLKLGNLKITNPRSLWQFFKLMRAGQKAAVTFAKENDLDFCLGAWALPSGLFAWSVKKQLGIPYAIWSLGSDLNQYTKVPVLKQLIIQALKYADFRFANSFALCDKAKKLSGKKADFLPAVTNFKTEKIKAHSFDKDVFNFLFVGRLELVKGPDILLEAIRHLATQRQDFKVWMLGDGTLQENLERKVKEYNLESCVSLEGRADGQKVAEFMSGAQSLVIPSQSESLPLVMIEAAKCHLPVVACEVGDCKRMIQEYKIGLSSAAKDPQALAEAMQEMMIKHQQIATHAKKGFDEINQLFRQPRVVELFIETIKR